MLLLLGVGLVAAFLLLASGHGMHAGMWRGSVGMHGYGPGFSPWWVLGLLGALVIVASGLFPLLLVFGGGFLLYRFLSGQGAPHVPAFSFRSHGAGGRPAPVEQGIYCPSCGQGVARDWATCPHCGYRKYVAPDLIQRRCATCGTDLQKDWNACPYCSSQVTAPLLVPAPGPAQSTQTTNNIPVETGTSV